MFTMNVLSSIGAINCFNHAQLKALEEAQDKCICKISSASTTSQKSYLSLKTAEKETTPKDTPK
ncbi:hypothetical protein RO3G_01635 [Rhizopus delemar RA 99-880]|uniref:Uncharacterized protein n=1 Tax=Rhizopus delemar (strain RA 99-880 / ATCC MYA-4621 / FGSC 9543 / NRRL 43880) TaxID=246409 RepID=I1BL51_RHIO9|nr:hypothetical protein RO3G_01635 [Rhizopus delemar RA 99-880]|eukprot:EIE76931.1 hypothetical protein RO3G_01635 [Rhizopus delemar RA 99-880]